MFKIEEAVRCQSCDVLFPIDSKEYVSIHGNICIGKDKGIIGNNFNKDGKLSHISVFCKKCLMKELREDNINQQSTRGTE